MNDQINYKNNPLHGVSVKKMVIELIDHYGFEILFAYLNINCFKTNPSIQSSVKFLKKTDWAREKVEVFYLYQYKNIPGASSEQFQLPPRERILPEGHECYEPAKLSLEDAEILQQKRVKKAEAYRSGFSHDFDTKSDRVYSTNRDLDEGREQSNQSTDVDGDPWAKWRK